MRTQLLCLVLALGTAGCASTAQDVPHDAVSPSGARIAPPVGSWRLVAFSGAETPVAANVTLVVQEDGKIGGSGGCNGYFGRWTLDDAQETLGPIGATRRMCQPEVMEVETAYFDALSRVGGWLPTDGGITLTDAAGRPLLTLRRE